MQQHPLFKVSTVTQRQLSSSLPCLLQLLSLTELGCHDDSMPVMPVSSQWHSGHSVARALQVPATVTVTMLPDSARQAGIGRSCSLQSQTQPGPGHHDFDHDDHDALAAAKGRQGLVTGLSGCHLLCNSRSHLGWWLPSKTFKFAKRILNF
jgi:hypothetical protein